jgi:transcriptional activator SPT8
VFSASVDNIRLWNIADGEDPGRSKSAVQFKIIPGHHGAYISQMSMDISSLSIQAADKIF